MGILYLVHVGFGLGRPLTDYTSLGEFTQTLKVCRNPLPCLRHVPDNSEVVLRRRSCLRMVPYDDQDCRLFTILPHHLRDSLPHPVSRDCGSRGSLEPRHGSVDYILLHTS